MIIEMKPKDMDSLVRAPSFKIDSKEKLDIFFNTPNEFYAPSPQLEQRVWFNREELHVYYTNNWRKVINFMNQERLFVFAEDSSYRKIGEQELLEIAGSDSIEELANQAAKPVISENIALHAFDMHDAVLMSDYKRVILEYPRNSDSFTTTMGKATRKINIFDGCVTSIDSMKYPTVWTPSIDTDLLRLSVSLLAERGMIPEHLENACEVGYACAAITKHFMTKTKTKSMYLFDINPEAKKCASEVLFKEVYPEEGNSRFRDNSFYFFEDGDGIDSLEIELSKGTRMDFLICNPPYLPKPTTFKREDISQENLNHYEGIGLPIQLIEKSSEYLSEKGQLLITLSNLSLRQNMHDAFSAALEKGMNIEILMRKQVPLKIYDLENDPEWQEYLGIKDQPLKQGYPFWQELYFLRFSKQ